MIRLVVVDVGGTHVRFAIANLLANGGVELEKQLVIRTREYPDLKSAWQHYAQQVGVELPREASMAFACPTESPVLSLTNCHWVITKSSIATDLGLDRVVILNDLAAVGHAVLNAPHDQLAHICGPDLPLPTVGVFSIVGPGTGLGVAQIILTPESRRIIATEGGHIGFAPSDDFDDALLKRLRARHGRVSVERVVSGPSLVDIYEVLANQRGIRVEHKSDKELWPIALDGTDLTAAAALNRFCGYLGSVAGDIALAQGAVAIVIAGGVGLRLANHLKASSFRAALTNKGRFNKHLNALYVKLITTSQPGLVGAAYAFTSK